MNGPLRVLAAVMLVAACGGEPARNGGAEDAAPDTGGAGMPMADMQMPSMEMMPRVRAYLDSLRVAGPSELTGMVAAHGERAGDMLQAMETDMQAMSMPADSAWTALTDSIRTDFRTLPQLTGEELVLRIRAHTGRMRRLLDRHEAMMGMMKM